MIGFTTTVVSVFIVDLKCNKSLISLSLIPNSLLAVFNSVNNLSLEVFNSPIVTL